MGDITTRPTIEVLGMLLHGLMVPVSVCGGNLGQGLAPALELMNRVDTFGYPSAEEITNRLEKLLKKEINVDV